MKNNRYGLLASLFLAFLFFRALTPRAEAAIYTAENMAIGALNGQDGWVFFAGFGTLDVRQGTGINPSKVISESISASGLASRRNDANFTFGSFTGLETNAVLQMDLFLRFSAPIALFGLGHDSVSDADNIVNQDSELGPLFGATTGAGPKLVIQEAGRGTSHLSSISLSTGTWYQLQLVINFTANGGNGAGSLFYRNLTLGDAVFTAVPDLQNVSLGILNTAADVKPATYDAMHLTLSLADVDNFGAIPEPSALSLVVIAGVIMVATRARHLRRSYRSRRSV